MKKDTFKDLLFQKLTEHDSFMKHVELDTTNDTFFIYCTDNNRFSLQIHESVSCFIINDYHNEYTYMENPIYTGEKSAYLHKLNTLAQENPFVFLIFIVLLKLSELDIVSDLEAQKLMENVQAHAEILKEQWDKNIRI